MDLIKIAAEAFASGKQHPEFGSGDTITVAYRIKEGNKERIQQYRGVVIRISGEGSKKRFTVRKMSENIGVERIFPIESPFIDSITINKYGKVQRTSRYQEITRVPDSETKKSGNSLHTGCFRFLLAQLPEVL